MRTMLVRCSLILIPVLALAQSEDYHRNNVTVGIGAAMPVGSASNYLSTAPLVTVGYGYRFNRFLQADAGFQFIFGAANNVNPEQTDLGVVQGGDHEYMIPLGGRVYVPTPFKKIEVSVGGGVAHLHYSESVPSNYYYSNTCYTCTSRGGWGGYGLANARYYLDENHNFHVGATYQFISASTNGQPVGDLPANKTTDHWSNIAFEFGLSF
jgi:hypothetical protein